MEELLRKLQKELDILANGFPEAELSLHVKYGKKCFKVLWPTGYFTDEEKGNMTTYIIAVSDEETKFHSADGNAIDLLTLIADIMKDFFRNPEELQDMAQLLYLELRNEKSSADVQDRQSDIRKSERNPYKHCNTRRVR